MFKNVKIGRRSVFLSIIALLFISLSLYAKSIEYIYGAVSGHINIMNARKPVAEELSDGTYDRNQVRKLIISQEVREFASDELDLPRNASYTQIADIKRDVAGWNVYSAPMLSVMPNKSCFPIAGCVTYRGFFSRDDALDYAKQKEESGDDVFVGPFNAYSTLGYFDDPILSSHLSLPTFRLAALIIHELAHQRLYLSGQPSVNEAFATVVEREGLRRWANRTGREELLRHAERAWAEEDKQVQRIFQAQQKLDDIFRAEISNKQKLTQKQKVFRELKGDLCGESCDGVVLPKTDGLEQAFNNAYLAPIHTYYGKYKEISRILRHVDGDLAQLYAEVERRYR